MRKTTTPDPAGDDRRAFLATAGKFAVVVPPAMTLLLSTSLSSPAIAASGIGGRTYLGDPDNDGDVDRIQIIGDA